MQNLVQARALLRIGKNDRRPACRGPRCRLRPEFPCRIRGPLRCRRPARARAARGPARPHPAPDNRGRAACLRPWIFRKRCRPLVPRATSAWHGSGRRSARGSAGSAPQPRGLDRVAHEHGDGERANSAGNRRDGSGDAGDVGMHVADEHGAFFAEFCEALGKMREEVFRLRGVGDAVVPTSITVAPGRM